MLERLDRIVANTAWSNSFPNFYSTNLDFYVSDHRPIMLKTDMTHTIEGNPGQKVFSFNHHWLIEDCFQISSLVVGKRGTLPPLYIRNLRIFRDLSLYRLKIREGLSPKISRISTPKLIMSEKMLLTRISVLVWVPWKRNLKNFSTKKRSTGKNDPESTGSAKETVT